MNRAQFMEQLKKLLSDISEEERQEALDYYESYFDDAGEDQEANVIRELGSPGKVAAIIKADLKDSSQDYGEYTEKGFEDERVRPEPEMMQKRGGRILGVIVTLALLPFLIVFGIGAAVLVLFAVGIAAFGAGIGACFSGSVGFGILGAGIGCIVLAVALVGLVFLIWTATRVLPMLLRKFVDFCSRLVNRNMKKEAGL